jgi:LysR family nitrogen assimilation transcriptional regulator
MDFRQLRYFLGVYEAKSITKAAERLNVAQPALGLQVRKLEEELGVDLFFRHSRGVTPTEAGQLLAEHARVLLRQFERVRQDLIDFGGQPHGRIAVGMTASSCLVVAAELVQRCRERYPEIGLTISEGLSERLMEWVGSDQIDLTLTYNPDAVKGLVCKPLVTEPLYFVQASTDGPPAGETITFAEAASHQLLLPSRPHLLRLQIDAVAHSLELEPEILYEVDSVAAIKELVENRLGATILPHGAVLPAVKSGRLSARRIEEPRIERVLHIAYSPQHPRSKAFIAVRQLIETVVMDLADSGQVDWQRMDKSGAAKPLVPGHTPGHTKPV